MRLRKIKPIKYRTADIYPMSNGMEMSFLEEDPYYLATTLPSKMLLTRVMDTRLPRLQHPDCRHDWFRGFWTVWSVLDQQGTQNMMRSALGTLPSLGLREPSRNAYWARVTP